MPSPGCAARTTDCVVELVALAKAAALPACRRQPPHLPVLVDWFGDPLGVRVSSDSFMEGIDEDNLKKLVRRIFTHPMYKLLCGYMLLSFLLGIYLGVELLGYRVTLCCHIEEVLNCFPK